MDPFLDDDGVDVRLKDPYNYIAMPLKKAGALEKQEYLFLNRWQVEGMCQREVVLTMTAKTIGKVYP